MTKMTAQEISQAISKYLRNPNKNRSWPSDEQWMMVDACKCRPGPSINLTPEATAPTWRITVNTERCPVHAKQK